MSTTKVRNYLDHISLRVPGDHLQEYDPNRKTKHDFKFYTMDLSYFSGKLEMYFRYKEISFERLEPHASEFETILGANTGSEQLPQVYDQRSSTPESKRWLRDTTPIIEYLETDPEISSHSRAVIPACPVQAFFHRLLEDYADEYLWRPAMWWRWEPAFDRHVMGHRFTWEFARETQSRYFFPLAIRPYVLSFRQWLLSCFGEDVTTEAKKDILKNQYLELLDILEGILSQQPYLFGQHPSLIDFGFAGPFFRHFSSDFTPRKVMQQRAPGVYEWMARLWNCKSSKMKGDGGFPAPGTLPECWRPLLKLLPEYLQYYRLNAQAFHRGQKTFSWSHRGETFAVPVVHYRVWCRQQLQKHLAACDAASQTEIRRVLEEYGCLNDLVARVGVGVGEGEGDVEVEVKPELGCLPPFALYPPPKRSEALLYKWDPDAILERYFRQFFSLSNVIFVGTVAALSISGYKCHRKL